MPSLSFLNPRTRRASLSLVAALIFGWGFRSVAVALADEPPSDAVGTIDGAAIAVNGPMRVEVRGGFTRTVLRSGSDVRVQSGVARLELVEGGTISICGPAHFSVLKSGGALTVALDAGMIHAHIGRELALTIYTAQVQAHAMPIGDGPQDILVGLDAPGTMCLRANRGAIRVEQQFTGQSVIIPQALGVEILEGKIESLREEGAHCVCDPQTALVSDPQPEISAIATAEEARKDVAASAKRDPVSNAAENAPAKEEPIYQVFMPPLVYDAKAKVQPDVDPNMIVLVRRARVRPSLIFQGRVEGEKVMGAAAAPPKQANLAPAPGTASASKPLAANDSLADRVRSFVRKLWSP